jgi:hypothetical protein
MSMTGIDSRVRDLLGRVPVACHDADSDACHMLGEEIAEVAKALVRDAPAR